MQFESDHADSDDMEAILEYTAREAAQAGPSQKRASSSKSEKQAGIPVKGDGAVYSKKQQLSGQLSKLENELQEVDEKITELQDLRAMLLTERQQLLDQLEEHTQSRPSYIPAPTISKGAAKVSHGAIDYMTEEFMWDGEMEEKMKKVFNVPGFRLCQRGVCNANMDGRDIVCVMPTGGGKSLTYQLPALLNPGLTLVISPLISLITDQVMHLRDFGVEAVMLRGKTDGQEVRDIYSRLAAVADGRSHRNADGATSREIKLCYVTPEKIAHSNLFRDILQRLANGGRLARIVVDEAHCVSQLGHDFRPDYKKLSLLRKIVPRVPILALSATCPPKVLRDLLKILQMKNVVAGTAATPDRTVYFSAPLYRKNLHYKVLPKPSSANAVLKMMSDYILSNHRDDSGIIYCYSKKDSENVAAGLYKESGGKIRTGVYHASVEDREKESLHMRWRDGDVKVVCATIAFGLGIDKGDVRFVLHHSLSKSLEGYYQESGRAGRDGKDSDCILYFRPQDATKIASLVCANEHDGVEKLLDMLRFSIDVEECRKIQFARYFSDTAALSVNNWGTSETEALAPCGHCDNCMRSPQDTEKRDMTIEAWKTLRVSQSVERSGGRVSLPMLVDLVRGVGGGTFGMKTGGGRKGKGKKKSEAELNLNEVGGKIDLGKDETETLVLHLVLAGYLKETFNATQYAVNTYISPGENALRLSRHELKDLQAGKGQRFFVTFLSSSASAKKAKKVKDPGNGTSKEAMGKKRKRGNAPVSDDDYFEDFVDEGNTLGLYADDELEPEDEGSRPPHPNRRRSSAASSKSRQRTERDLSSDVDEDWSFTMSGDTTTHSTTKSAIQPLRHFSYDPSSSALTKSKETDDVPSSASRYGGAAASTTSAPRPAAFTPNGGASKPVLTSSLSRSKPMSRPGVESSCEPKRGVFKPSTSSFARAPFGGDRTNLTSRSSRPTPLREVDDIIEINSETE